MKKYFRVVRVVLIILFSVLLFSYLVPLSSGILNLGNLFGICASTLILAAFIWYKRLYSAIRHICQSKLGKAVACGAFSLCLAFVVAFLTTLGVICSYAQNTATDESTVIVLGCKVNGETPSLQLYHRTMVACDYLQSNPNAVAILSGGQGSDENISEAQCMYNLLTEQGIDAERLYMEDKSTSTAENFEFSKVIAEKNGLSMNVAVATNDYHEKRASVIAERIGFTTSSIPAKCDIYTCTTFFTREVFAIWAQYLI